MGRALSICLKPKSRTPVKGLVAIGRRKQTRRRPTHHCRRLELNSSSPRGNVERKKQIHTKAAQTHVSSAISVAMPKFFRRLSKKQEIGFDLCVRTRKFLLSPRGDTRIIRIMYVRTRYARTRNGDSRTTRTPPSCSHFHLHFICTGIKKMHDNSETIFSLGNTCPISRRVNFSYL
jgi:hypothetical protein